MREGSSPEAETPLWRLGDPGDLSAVALRRRKVGGVEPGPAQPDAP
jgi:hypothetical protein